MDRLQHFTLKVNSLFLLVVGFALPQVSKLSPQKKALFNWALSVGKERAIVIDKGSRCVGRRSCVAMILSLELWKGLVANEDVDG